MFEVNKQITLDINIDQEGIEKLIHEEMKRKDPSVVIDSIEFIQRRKPTSLDVSVEAHIEGQGPDPKQVTEEAPEEETPIEAEEPVEVEVEVEAVEKETTPAPVVTPTKAEPVKKVKAKEAVLSAEVFEETTAAKSLFDEKEKDVAATVKTMKSLFDS
jgi:hypothetical protein